MTDLQADHQARTALPRLAGGHRPVRLERAASRCSASATASPTRTTRSRTTSRKRRTQSARCRRASATTRRTGISTSARTLPLTCPRTWTWATSPSTAATTALCRRHHRARAAPLEAGHAAHRAGRRPRRHDPGRGRARRRRRARAHPAHRCPPRLARGSRRRAPRLLEPAAMGEQGQGRFGDDADRPARHRQRAAAGSRRPRAPSAPTSSARSRSMPRA